MESLFNNKPMLYSVTISGSAIVALASGLMPEANEYFELVQLPDDVSTVCMFVIFEKEKIKNNQIYVSSHPGLSMISYNYVFTPFFPF